MRKGRRYDDLRVKPPVAFESTLLAPPPTFHIRNVSWLTILRIIHEIVPSFVTSRSMAWHTGALTMVIPRLSKMISLELITKEDARKATTVRKDVHVYLRLRVSHSWRSYRADNFIISHRTRPRISSSSTKLTSWRVTVGWKERNGIQNMECVCVSRLKLAVYT